MERQHVRRSRRGIASAVMVATGLTAFVVGVTSGVGGALEGAPGQCPAGYEKALESAGSDGFFTTFVYKGVTFSTSDGFTVDWSSTSENVSGVSVGGGASRNTVAYVPPEDSSSVASPDNPSGNQAAISNICVRFATTTTTAGVEETTTTVADTTTTTVADTTTTTVADTTTTTVADTTTTTTTAADTTTTTAADTTTTTAGIAETTTTTAEVEGVVETTTTVAEEPTTTTEAEVLGEVVERPRAAPEELAFTGNRLDPLWMALAGLGLMLAGAGLYSSQRLPAMQRHQR